MGITRAIFFDWYNTLARYEPPREEICSRALHEFGIEVIPQKLLPGLMAGDVYFFNQSRTEKRDAKAKAEVYAHYMSIVLDKAGVSVAKEKLPAIMKKMQELSSGMTFALFDDVLSTLNELKARGLILGILTNASRKMIFTRSLGLEPYLDFIVTSEEAGADKPQPPIFLAALRQAEVEAPEAVHVGDQYQLDVAGARGVGITPILLDRFNVSPDVTDCTRIQTLPELVEHI